MADDLDELTAALPEGRVSTDPDIVDSYGRDQTTAVTPGKARCLVSARSTEEVVATLRWASRTACRWCRAAAGPAWPAARPRSTAV